MNDHEELNANPPGKSREREQNLVQGLIEQVADLHRQIAALRRELAALAEYRASRDRLLVLDDARTGLTRLPRFVVIEADHLLQPRDGFYGVEYTAGNVAFRWTGPSTQFSFNLFIDRSHGAELRLDALSCIDFERQRKMRLLVDGESVPVSIDPHEGGFVVLAKLPQRCGVSNTNLVFILPVVLVPPESTDSRELGIAFSQLSVTACAGPGPKPASRERPDANACGMPDAAHS
jgi:hypothetical protein